MNEDPIVSELMKLHPHNSRLIISNIAYNEQVVQYSAKLQELLYLLLDENQLDDNTRITIETSLAELTTSLPILKHDNYTYESTGASNRKYKNRQFLPHPKPTDLTYPNNYLSKILIDNFDSLIRFSKTYFNLSLASQVTKYTVELIYQLYYWEVVHLVFLNPSMIDFLTLLKFEIVNTSFGPIIRPPDTYLNDNMLQGLQYPYPYPFYNYSYHSFNGRIENDKFNKVKITPYIDITLKNYNGPAQKKRKRGKKSKLEPLSVSKDASFREARIITAAELSRTVSETSDYESKDRQATTEIQTHGLPSVFGYTPIAQQQQEEQQQQRLETSLMTSSLPDGTPSALATLVPNARHYPQTYNQSTIYGNNQSPPLASLSKGDVFHRVQSPSQIAIRSELFASMEAAATATGESSPPHLRGVVTSNATHQQFPTSDFQSLQVSSNDQGQQSLDRKQEEIRIPPISNESDSPAHIERPLVLQQSLQQSPVTHQPPVAESISASSSVHSTIPRVNPIANYKGLTDNLLPSISKLRNDQQSSVSLSGIPSSSDNRMSPTISNFNMSNSYPYPKTEQFLPPTTSSPISVTAVTPQAGLHIHPSQQQQQQAYLSNFSSPQLNISATATPPAPGSSTNISHTSYQDQSIDEKTKKQKSGVIHQCHLIDPNTRAECMKIFYGKNELLRHQEFVHATKKKIYKCIYCAKNGSKIQSYPRHDSLARHIRRKHGITGKENKIAVNYAKENVEILDQDQLVTKQHDFQEPAMQTMSPAQVVPPHQILYSHPIRYGRPAPIPSYLQHRRLNLFPQTHRLNKGQQRAYSITGPQPGGSQVTISQNQSQTPGPIPAPVGMDPMQAIVPSFPPQGSPSVSSSTMLPSPREIINSPPYNTPPMNVASSPLAAQFPHFQDTMENTHEKKP